MADICRIHLLLYIVFHWTTAQFSPNNRGGFFVQQPFQGQFVSHGLQIHPPNNIISNFPSSFDTGSGIPLNPIAGGNVPLHFNVGNSVPLSFNTGRNFPASFNSLPVNSNNVVTFPVNFNTGNNFPPQISSGNNLPMSVNNGMTFPSVPNQGNSINLGRSVSINSGSNTPLTTGSSVSTSNSLSGNEIQFIDPTGTGNTITVDLGSDQFTDLGIPLNVASADTGRNTVIEQTSSLTTSRDPNISLHAVDVHLRNQLGVPQEPTHLTSPGIDLSQDLTNLANTGSSASQPSTIELGNIDVLRGSNNFLTTNSNTAAQVTTDFPGQLSSRANAVSSMRSPQPALLPTTFDFMGDIAGPLHDPLMFFGLTDIMDLDLVGGPFMTAITNPVTPATVIQMAGQTVPSFNFLTPSSNINAGQTFGPSSPSVVTSTVPTVPTFPSINGPFSAFTNQNSFAQNNGQFLGPSRMNLITSPTNNQFQHQLNPNPFGTSTSPNQFRNSFNWNPATTPPPLPRGFEFLSGIGQNMFSSLSSGNVPGLGSRWFDPVLGIALEESRDPSVKMSKVSKEKIQPITIGKGPMKAVRVVPKVRHQQKNPAYTNTSPY